MKLKDVYNESYPKRLELKVYSKETVFLVQEGDDKKKYAVAVMQSIGTDDKVNQATAARLVHCYNEFVLLVETLKMVQDHRTRPLQGPIEQMALDMTIKDVLKKAENVKV